MGISFCRHQLLLPLFQETYGHNTAANKREIENKNFQEADLLNKCRLFLELQEENDKKSHKLCSQLNIGNYTQIWVLSLGTCCPPREQRLFVSCSPVPHHVVPEGPLEEHGRNLYLYWQGEGLFSFRF